MCVGGDFGKSMFTPAGMSAPDPISSAVVDKVAPDAVKNISPQKLAGAAIDGVAGDGTAKGLIQAGDPRGLMDGGQSWNDGAAQKQSKNLLGD